MAGIKLTQADIAFSKCIRERAGWKCERCGTKHQENSQGLHCSHHYRRGNWGVRFHPLNAESLCFACHMNVGGTHDRMREVLTEFEYDILRDLVNDTGLGKMYRRTKGKGEIAKHFRDELERMKLLRERGVTGRIEFEAWL